MFAGRYFKRVDLDPGAKVPVRMDIVADEPKDLEITPEQLKPHRALVQQAYKLFGSHHYDHYDFLLALSDQQSHIGLEHHRSSEDGTEPAYFTEWDRQAHRARSARARIHPFVERQVSPSRRSCDTELQRADGRQPALGLRGTDAVLGLRARGALGSLDSRPGARRAGAGCFAIHRQSARFLMAQRAGHDQRSGRGAAPAAAVPQLPVERGLLQRRAR